MSKARKKASEDLRKQLNLEKKLTKEEIIALNKAKVAKFHPAPDFSSVSPKISKERMKIKHEKKMLEKAKKIWHSIVSVPMGGMNKK
jgi:hypothetical protein